MGNPDASLLRSDAGRSIINGNAMVFVKEGRGEGSIF